MTVKTTFALLLLTCVALSAANPPGGDAPDAAAAAAASPAPATPIAPPTLQPAPTQGGLPTLPGQPAGMQRRPGAPNRPSVPTVSSGAATGAAPGAAPIPTPAPGGPISIPDPAVTAAATAAANQARAAAAPPPSEEEVIIAGGINFRGADLDSVLIKYAEMVNRSVLRAPTLPNPTFFFVNQTPLTKMEAIQAYQALFAMNGIAVIEVGDKFMKVVTAAESIQQGQKPTIVTNAADLGELGQYVTHIVQLKYAKPTELVPILTPFQKMANAIFPIDSSQILVIRDFTENVKRMLEMIQKVDVTVQSEFESRVVPIKFAKAEDIASALSSLSGSGSSTTVGSRPAGGSTAPSGGLGSRPGLGGYQQGGMGMQNQLGGMGGNPTGQPSAGGSFSDRINQIINRAAKTSGSGDFQIIGPNKIVADVRSNSLMIFASRSDISTITNIIAQLDIVLAQVVIETIIMDVSLDDSFSFGISGIQTPRTNGSFTGAGGMNANKFFDFAGRSNTNSAGDLLGSGIKYFGKVNEDIFLSIEAMASDGRINVIQKPRVQTSHATPASIFIGNTVPYVSSTYYGGGYGGGPSSSYQQLSVGIGLNVTPFINADGLVVMKIDETIDEISSYTKIDNNSVPNTSHRTISAEVAVRDRETILLGGFIRNQESKNKSGVPFLKDIPLLGNLFSSQDSTKSRKELMVLMRPTVLRTPELASMHVADEKAEMPMIRAAEEAAAQMERELAGKSARNRRNSSKGTPFTPEEIKLYGDPSSAPAPASTPPPPPASNPTQ